MVVFHFLLLSLIILHSCIASPLNVPSVYADLQSAVNAAIEGDEIRIAAGVYPCSNVVVSSVSSLTISGEPLGETVFDCNSNSSGQMRAMSVNSPNTRISLSFMTFKNGYVSDNGGAVAITSSSLVSAVVTNCSFINNTALGIIGGGGLVIMGNSNSVIQVTGCDFYCNNAPNENAFGGGGGLAIYFNNTSTGANVEITGGEMVGNIAAGIYGGGGALVGFNQDMKNCSVVVDGGIYQNNNAPDGGGILIGVLGNGMESSITLRNGIYTNNTAGYIGGGAFVGFNQDMTNCSVVVDGGAYQNNMAGAGGGGGILILIQRNGIESSITLRNGIYTNNTAQPAGGAFVYFKQNMTNCSVVVDGGAYQNNMAGAAGGGGIGIWIERNVENSIVVFTHCSFISNAAAGSSGGGGAQVIVQGQCTDTNMTFDNLMLKSNIANQGGGVAIAVYGATLATAISVTRSSFVSNKAYSSGGGISVDLYGNSNATSPANVILEDCNFTSNQANGLGGGALVVLPARISLLHQCATCNQPSTTTWYPPSDPICQFPPDPSLCTQIMYVNNYMQNYYIPTQQTAILNISRTLFLQNRVDGSGGGLAISNGKISLQYVNFTANQASQQGGGAYIAGTVDITFLDSTSFDDNTAASQTALFSNSRGRINVEKNGSITINSSPPSEFKLDQGQFEASGIVESSGVSVGGVFRLRCPMGFLFVNDSSTRQNISIFESGWPNAMLASSYSGSCIACGAGSYSMLHGFQNIYQDNTSISNWACQNCPAGANCQQGMDKILALENYWGHLNPESKTWNFSRCPLGYCCNNTAGCDPMNGTASCAEGRNNSVPLCGACKDGHSQNLIGDACTKNEDCNEGKWVWPVFCVLVLLWVTILILTSSERASSNYNKKSGDMSWILPTLMFFFQNAYFLFTAQGGLPRPILEIVGIANLHISSKPKGGSSVCVKQDLSTTSAVALQLLVPAAIFVTLGLYHLIVKMIMRMTNQDIRRSRKWLKRTAPAAIQTGLITYSTLISVCGTLLHCTNVALGQNETTSVLYKAGGVSCGRDNRWMPWLSAVFGIVVVPFPLMLFAVQVFVRKRGIISHTISAVEKPYKHDRWYWPSVVLLRRLAIAIVYAFDEDPASQGIWFCVLFMFFMLLQLLTTPHKTQRGNAVETCSLVVLTVMSLCALRTGSYLEANVILASVDTAEKLSNTLDVVQTLIFFAPAVLTLILVAEHRMRKRFGIADGLLNTAVRKGSDWLKMSQGIELSSIATERSGTEGKFAREAELLRVELADKKAEVGALKERNGSLTDEVLSLQAELRHRKSVERMAS